MIKAVIFDCFGVLATDGWLPFKHEYFKEDQEKWQRATELNHMVDARLISYPDFTREIAELAEVQQSQVDSALKSAVPNKQLFTLITSDLKPKYKIGLLSNVADDWLKQMFTQDEIALFDEISLSYQTGFIKPSPEAYKVILDKLSLEPEECVFIDDQERNVTAAVEQGMQGIVYTQYETFEANLAHTLSKA